MGKLCALTAQRLPTPPTNLAPQVPQRCARDRSNSSRKCIQIIIRDKHYRSVAALADAVARRLTRKGNLSFMRRTRGAHNVAAALHAHMGQCHVIGFASRHTFRHKGGKRDQTQSWLATRKKIAQLLLHHGLHTRALTVVHETYKQIRKIIHGTQMQCCTRQQRPNPEITRQW